MLGASQWDSALRMSSTPGVGALFPSNRTASTPPLGAHPDKSEWFHLTPIHNIMDGFLANIDSYY